MLSTILVAAPIALQPPFLAATSRRAALHAASYAAVLPLAANVGAATAAAVRSFEDDVKAGFGQTGALRADEPESLNGKSVDIVIKDLSYVELKACPKNFFIPPKEGPWTCIEVSGSKNTGLPSTGERKETPLSVIFRIDPKLKT